KKLENKNYHIITTNAYNAFYAAEYDMNKVFRIQGEYGLWQCIDHCHQQTYQNNELIRQIVAVQANLEITANLVPKCPKCVANLEVNKLTEEKGMVEDAQIQEQKARYEQFLQ